MLEGLERFEELGQILIFHFNSTLQPNSHLRQIPTPISQPSTSSQRPQAVHLALRLKSYDDRKKFAIEGSAALARYFAMSQSDTTETCDNFAGPTIVFGRPGSSVKQLSSNSPGTPFAFAQTKNAGLSVVRLRVKVEG